MSLRQVSGVAVVFTVCLAATTFAQIPGQNVNMVAGTEWPGGDPFLQRQNEPSMAVSSRNPLHLLAGANDYRTVDLPGLPNGGVTGDAWLGLFKSTNGGGRWTSTLLPGYPQDSSPDGMASPLKGLHAGADAVVRPGSHGLFYFGGLAFNRGDNQPSRIFLARYQDRNNKENGDPFVYQGTSIVAANKPGQFLDKPSFAVDVPRTGSGSCNVDGVATPGGAVYAAWSVFLSKDHPHGRKDKDDDDEGDESEGSTSQIRSRIMFSRSADCGRTWSGAKILSDSRTNQGSAIAIDPRNGHIYVAWRQFETWHWIHAIFVRKSTDGGRTFGPKIPIWGFFPFDQGTSNTSFRTNSYPTIAVDHTGRVYVAWSARAYAADHDPINGDARIVVSTSKEGLFWTFPRSVDNFPGRGHQFMPALTYAGGKLQLVYYDVREDVSGFFERFVDEFNILRLPPGTPGKKRHTLDVRTAQASPALSPQFASYSVTGQPSSRASQYPIGSRPGSSVIEQLQFSPPNLPLFALGSTPFIGDYIDVAARTVVPDGLNWRFSRPGDDPVFHLVWADNRDVRPPLDGDWTNYTPPTFAGSGGPSVFDPGQQVQVCVPGQAGMRNQNIYTSRVSPGLVVGSPGNAKPLSTNFQRSFVVFAQNTTDRMALYRFSISNQPPGGYASFLQFDGDPATPVFDVLAQVEVLVAARSSAARSLFVTSTDPDASVRVDIQQIAGGGSTPPPGGLGGTVILNPDVTNPDVTNPDVTNPDVTNPDVTNAETHNPDVTNPDVTNPDVTNPDVTNPDVTNPDVTNIEVANPDVTNPDVTNPDVTNPDVTNPDVTNPDVTNQTMAEGEITDYTYTATNNGNTASQYNLNLDDNQPVPTSVLLQLIIHRIYRTPVVDGCNLKLETQNQVLANIPHPLAFGGPITFWLEPGESVKLTFRVVDTDRDDDIRWDPRQDLDVEVEAGAVNFAADNGADPNGPSRASATPPVAFDDAYEVQGGGTLEVPAPGVRVNDVVFGREMPKATLVTGPLHAASFDLRSDGSFTYVPNPRFAGTDTFRYVLLGGLRSNIATVTIDVFGDPLTVTNTDDEGLGSLRFAIEYANTNPNAAGVVDMIAFAISGEESLYRITPRTLLPVVTDAVLIDGTTHPGYYGRPAVIIDGRYLPREIEGAYGLAITAGGSEVRGLAIVNTPGKGLVLSRGDSNVVRANWIGLDPDPQVDGAAAPNHEAGLAIMDGSDGNRIGGDCAPERPCARDDANVISGNRGAGIQIYQGSGNTIRGNFIGTDASGSTPYGNVDGIGVSGGVNNRIGGAYPGQGNVISGNVNGVVLLRDSIGSAIEGNTIGLAADGATSLPNRDGVLIGSTGNRVAGNVISGNTRFGIEIGPGADANMLKGNHVGVTRAGNVARGNGLGGVYVVASKNVIGGYAPSDRNVISGNGSHGIRIAAPAASNTVIGNYVGTDASGVADLGNAGEGIRVVDSANNVVGGGKPGERNVISGNGGEGIGVFGQHAQANRIQGNYIGLSASGATDLGNSASGIYLRRAPGNVVEDNVVSGNDGFAGIAICGDLEFCGGENTGAPGTAGANVVRRNRLGLDGAGTGAMGNAGHGISIDAAPNTAIGGVGQGNHIAGSGNAAIAIFKATATGTVVQDNVIGFDVYGAKPFPNRTGVHILSGASDTLIGGSGKEGNVIAFSTTAGVFVEGDASVRNRIVGNAIFANGGLNIDLAPAGATQNDRLDVDKGPNYLQNFPVITGATLGYGRLRVSGTINTLPGAQVRVEIYRNKDGCEANRGGPEIREFIGERTFVTNEGGDGDFVADLYVDGEQAYGSGITATATGTAPGFGSNTSEISACVVATPPLE
jgi:parallel beta-helix repeat protein